MVNIYKDILEKRETYTPRLEQFVTLEIRNRYYDRKHFIISQNVVLYIESVITQETQYDWCYKIDQLITSITKCLAKKSKPFRLEDIKIILENNKFMNKLQDISLSEYSNTTVEEAIKRINYIIYNKNQYEIPCDKV